MSLGPRGLPIIGYLPFLAPTPHLKITALGKKYGRIFSIKMGSYEYAMPKYIKQLVKTSKHRILSLNLKIHFSVVVLNDYELIKEAMSQPEFSGRPNFFAGLSVMKYGMFRVI